MRKPDMTRSTPNRRAFLTASSVAGLAAAAAPAALAQAPDVASRATRQSAPGVPATPILPTPTPRPTNGLTLDPRAFGAKGDGVTKDTVAFQTALDRAAVLGGGEVIVSAGVYLIGALRIGSNTVLHVEEGATLQGSPDVADYPVTQVRWEGKWTPGYIGLISAHGKKNIILSGKGRILASDAIERRIEQSTGLRHPCLLEFVDVQGLTVTDLYTRQNDQWSIHPVYCDDVIFRGMTVNGKADGIDVDSCRRVVIDRCNFDTVDDCISLKSGRGMEGNVIARPTEDVTITDCVFVDHRWACIGIGSETSAGVRRVLVERCRCDAAHTFAIYIKSRPGRGAFIEDIAMRDLEVKETGYGFLRINILEGGKQDQFPVPGLDGIPTIRNFLFERIKVVDVPVLVEAVQIHPDKPLDGFVLRDVTGTAGRGMTLVNMKNVELSNINVSVYSGLKLAIDNVTGIGLDGAARLVPPDEPAPIAASDPAYHLGVVPGRPN